MLTRNALLKNKEKYIEQIGRADYEKLLNRLTLQEDADKVVEIYQKDRFSNNTPMNTAKNIIKVLGKKRAKEIIAALVIAKGDWDGRIYQKNRDWAKSNSKMTKEELNKEYSFYYKDAIHPSHLDTLVDSFRNLEELSAIRAQKTTKLPSQAKLDRGARRGCR